MKILSAAALGAAMLGALAASPARAVTVDPGLRAPAAAENVACRVVSTTSFRHGRRVTTRRTVCDTVVRPPIVHPRCQTIRERVVRPSGRVVVRTRTVCRR